MESFWKSTANRKKGWALVSKEDRMGPGSECTGWADKERVMVLLMGVALARQWWLRALHSHHLEALPPSPYGKV